MPDKYIDRVVAFVDILGFSRLIAAADNDRPAVELIDELERVLGEDVAAQWHGPLAGHPDAEALAESEGKGKIEITNFTIKMFSDCICTAAPPNYFGYMWTVLNLANIQKALLKHRILLRGAIALGRHYQSDAVIFSEALVRAYQLESHVAMYPRIILDAPLVSRFVQCLPEGNAREVMMNILLLRDSDNQVFVNYHSLVNDSEINRTRERNLELERKLIVEGRVEHSDDFSIMTKLAWLERYHNFVCQRMASSRPDLLIGSADDHGFQMLIPRDGHNSTSRERG
ncbi:MAG: hypothetical protein AB1601_10790 [Planctomycetota bacterium]